MRKYIVDIFKQIRYMKEKMNSRVFIFFTKFLVKEFEGIFLYNKNSKST